jgi:hypothetical protein
MKTLTDRIIEYVHKHPGATVTDVAKRFAGDRHRSVMGTYSGIMHRLVRRVILRRFRGGPRGGYGYWISMKY